MGKFCGLAKKASALTRLTGLAQEGEWVGCRVLVCKCSRAGLNGQQGEAQSWNADSGRYNVKLDSGAVVALKPANVQRVVDPTPPTRTPTAPSAPDGPTFAARVSGAASRCLAWWAGLDSTPRMCVVGGVLLVLWWLCFSGSNAGYVPSRSYTHQDSGPSHSTRHGDGYGNARYHSSGYASRRSGYFRGDSRHQDSYSSPTIGVMPALVFCAVAVYGYRQGWSMWTILSVAQMAQGLVGGRRGGYGHRGYGGYGMRRGFL